MTETRHDGQGDHGDAGDHDDGGVGDMSEAGQPTLKGIPDADVGAEVAVPEPRGDDLRE